LRYRIKSPGRSQKTLSFGEKIAKIGPADPEIIVLREIIEKKKEITEGKTGRQLSSAG